jgi:two-component system chemotaxis sensor kinase CheA
MRVPIEKVDRLVNLVGELVISQAAVTQIASNFAPNRLNLLLEAVGGMEQICRELQERILGVRMLPFKGVFDRLPRQVRDVASGLGKRVRLEVRGEDTELDKSVIERIGDPLVHLIRNAIDHGIEKPDVRIAHGKPPEGTLRVSAYQRGGSVFVEVSDDGAGLDREKILAKARAQSLISVDATPAPADVWALIFLPGFSTAASLTEVSGRGVGMDVVKRTVDELKGQVQIESTAGQGSRFRIQLPLTLAILDGLAVEVGGQAFIVPLTSVVESMRPSAKQLRRLGGETELIDARGEFQPLVRLHRSLAMKPRIEDPTKGIVVFVDVGSHRYGLLVDDVLGQFQVVLKSLEANYAKVQGLAGATVMGDGRVAMILDLHELATQAEVDSMMRSWA